MDWEHFWSGKAWSLKNRFQRYKFPRAKGIQVFGSARPQPVGRHAHLYALGVAVGKAIAERGYFPVTGGGPGMMKAVMEGASKAGGHAVGVTVPIAQETPSTEFMPEAVHAPNFADRLHGFGGFNYRAGRILVLPGGAGTDREFFSALEEYAYGDHLCKYPLQKQIVLLDYEQFFSMRGGLLDHINHLIQVGMMSEDIFQFIRVTESIEEALDWLTDPTIPWTR
jgi:uncharacterized protein (TIGR00730 family)